MATTKLTSLLLAFCVLMTVPLSAQDAPGTLLEVVPTPSGVSFAAWFVEAHIERADGQPLGPRDGASSLGESAGGARLTMTKTSAAGLLALAFAVNTDGSAPIVGMPSGVPLRVTLRDGNQVALAEPVDVTLGQDETRLVTVHVEMADRHAGGTVRDADGRPVAGAEVIVLVDTTSVARGLTGPDGRFSCRWQAPAASAVDVLFRADDGQTAGLVPLSAGPQPDLSVTLGGGRSATLVVQCPNLDAPVFTGPTAQLRERDVTGSLRIADSPGPGLFELEGLPEADVDLSVEFAGRRFSSKLHADEELGVIHLPRVGSLEVKGPEAHGPDCVLQLLALEDDGGSQVLPVGTGESVEFPVVLPGRYRVEVVGCDHASGGPVTTTVRHGESREIELAR